MAAAIALAAAVVTSVGSCLVVRCTGHPGYDARTECAGPIVGCIAAAVAAVAAVVAAGSYVFPVKSGWFQW